MHDHDRAWRPNATSLHQAVDVWHLRLTGDEAIAQDLSEDEIRRADRFRVESARTQFVAARAQLRRILGSYLEVSPGAVQFDYGEHGKPALARRSEFELDDIEFNLSHSKTAGLLGVTRGIPLGVDVELEKPRRRFEGIARRFFAAEEYAALMTLQDEARSNAFYRAWACKEAYLKAWGTGLTFPSNRFTIRYVDASPPVLLTSEMPSDKPSGAPSQATAQWNFRTVRTLAGYAAAICYPGDSRWIRHFAPSTLLCSDS